MSFSLFTINQAKDGLEMSDLKIKDFLSAELGFSSAKARNEKILITLADPAAAITKYNSELDKVVKKGATHYKTDYEKLLSLGLTDEKAQQYAKEKAEAFITDEKRILDFEYPLMNDINTLASAKAHTSINLPIQQKGLGRKRK